MSVLHFRAEEVLEMAEAIEEKGMGFYRRAVELFSEMADTFLELGHEVFPS